MGVLLEAAPGAGEHRKPAPGAPAKPLLSAHAVAEVGPQREHQEDAYGFKPPAILSPSERKRGMLFVVADGVGGEKAGELASRIAVQSILRAYYQSNRPGREALRHAIAKANADICERAKHPAFARMATTVVCALLKGGQLVIAHVGDSRAYLYRGGRLLPLTTDHSWVADEVRGHRMTPEEAARSPMRHVITRSLGRRELVEADLLGYGPVQEGDRVLLCTDGLHDVVPEERMAEVLRRYGGDEACNRLATLAIDNGSEDNITVLLVEVSLVEGEDESWEPEAPLPPPPAEAHRDETEPRSQQLVSPEAGVAMDPPGEGRSSETPVCEEVNLPVIAEWSWEACRPRMDLEAKEMQVALPGNGEILVQMDFPAKDPTHRLQAVRVRVEARHASDAHAARQDRGAIQSVWIMPFAWAQESGGMALVGRTGSRHCFAALGASVTCEVEHAVCNTVEERFFRELILRFKVEAGPAQAAE